MYKHTCAVPQRPRASSSRLGIIAGSLLAIGLSACGGGGDAPSAPESTATQQSSTTEQSRAQAQAAATDAPASDVITGAGWVAQPPTMASKSTYTPSYTGTAYYFDPNIANDSGHDGKSPEQAWKYLWRAGQKRDWQAGDAILLKCGSVWRDQSLSLNGGVDPTLKNGLLVAAYGCDQTPQRPVISGASALPVAGSASWNSLPDQPGAYGITLNGPIKRLYRNGQPQTPARYPNEQAGKRFAITAELPKLSPSETDDQLKVRKHRFFKVNEADRLAIGSRDIVGATVYVRTNPYTVETARVQSFNSGTGLVELASALKFTIEPTAGYILEGKPWMVDQAGEWAMDGNTLRYASAALPVTAELGAVIPRKSSQGADLLSYGLWFAQVDNMRIEYLRFEYNDVSIDLDQSSSVSISDIESVHAYDGAVLVGNSPKLQVIDSRMDHSGLNGIRIFKSNEAVVRGNVVSNTGLYRVANPEGAGVNPGISLQGWAIRVQGEGTLVERNLVQDSANVGIAFSDEMGTIVRHNTVLRPCLLLTDCGGIYTSNDAALGTNDVLNVPEPDTITSRVYGNLVAGLRSNLDGSFIWGALRDHIAGENQANGIYLDAGTTTVEVFNNVISGAEVGIFLHNSAYNVIRNNVTQGISYASFFVGSDSEKNPWITRGNRVAYNNFFSRRTVDGAAFGKATYKGVRGELTHAQLWMHTSKDARTFFQDNAGKTDRNVSVGNQTLTLSRVTTPSVWRLEAADRRDGVTTSLRMEQVSGAVWGLKSFYDPIEQLGLADWLALTGSADSTPDSESSPVSYRTHNFASTSTSILTNGEFKGTLFGTWQTDAGTRQYLAWGCPTATSHCAEFKATGLDDRMTSVPFDVLGGQLYQVSYTVASSSTQAVRHSAHIGAKNAPSTVMAPLSTVVELKAGEVRRIETFARPQAGVEASMSLRASDGTAPWFNKKAYWADAAVKPVSNAVSVLPPLNALGITAINASNEPRTFTCADLGMTDCSQVVHAHNNLPVTFPVKVVPRNALRFYVRLGTQWMDQ